MYQRLLRLRHCVLSVVLLSLLLLGSTTAVGAITAEASEYLMEALDVIQDYALNSDNIGWESWRQTALRRAENAQTAQDTHSVIRETLQKLRDGHSFFIAPSPETSDGDTSPSTAPDFTAPTGTSITEEIAVLTIPACSGAHDENTTARYAQIVHHLISTFRSDGVRGWIVDLRSNTGGNMWPMLAGLGPVLGEGTAGYFLYPTEEHEIAWGYRDGGSFFGDVARVSVDPSARCPTADPLPPVAVLIGPRTASSGEATAVAFIGRENARLFGRASCGLTTANRGFALSDGATIILTVAVYADRTGEQYGRAITPDEVILPTAASARDDPVIDAAAEWLRERIAACAG